MKVTSKACLVLNGHYRINYKQSSRGRWETARWCPRRTFLKHLEMILQCSLPSSSISIKTMTWTKDSYGLYDYQCKDPRKTQYDTTESFELLREGDVVEKRKPNEVQSDNEGQAYKRDRIDLQSRV